MRLEKVKTVYILGAGASQDCGGPLMKDFLDEAYTIRRYTQLDIDKDCFDLVFEAISSLDNVFAKSNLTLRNIESVFAAFEMSELFGRLGTLDLTKVNSLGPAIRRLIVQTLEYSVKFPRGQRGINPPQSYEWFVNHLLETISRAKAAPTIITFNYDIALDFALEGRIPFSYCLKGECDDAHVPYLKLHGSINWSRCTHCGEVRSHGWDSSEIFDVAAGTSATLHFSRKLRTPHCETTPSEIAIVPPTWNKTQHYREIAQVWNVAAAKLSEADNIIVCGYSLPATDQFFRYLFALGTAGKSRIQRFWVFDPSGEVDTRFRDLLGPVTLDRYQLVSGRDGHFSNAIKYLGQTMLPR